MYSDLILDEQVKAEILEILDNIQQTYEIALIVEEHDTGQFDFGLSASPPSITVFPGETATYIVGVSLFSGVSESVSLSVSGLPSGATSSITPTSVTPTGTATLEVITDGTITSGTHELTITGAGDAITKSITVDLIVGGDTFDFDISAFPSSNTVAQGQSTSYDVDVDLLTGTAQPVSLSVSGLPSGATADITPSSVTPTESSILFITTDATTPAATHQLTITATGGELTKSTIVDLVVVSITSESFITDSKFNQIDSFDAVFKKDKETKTLELHNTNPATYYYNEILTNTGTSDIVVDSILNIPASVDPALDQAFCLKGSTPVHIYSDLARTSDVTSEAIIDPIQPISDSDGQSLKCQSTVSASFTIPVGEIRYITTHLDFNVKGTTGYADDAPDTYRQSYKLKEDFVVDGINSFSDLATVTAVGKKVTAIGGFALDVEGIVKTGLFVQVFDGADLIGESSITPPDGFYFVEVPKGGPYKVKLFNSELKSIKTSTVSVDKDEYVQVDFLNINPADPAIEGYVFDSDTQGVSDVALNLYKITGEQSKLFASTTTEDGGWYVFRFFEPGTYTVEITPPPGFTTDKTSETINIDQFATVRIDFRLIEGTPSDQPSVPTEGLTVLAWIKPDFTAGDAEYTVVSKERSFILSVNNIIPPEHIAKISYFDGIKWTTVEGITELQEEWNHLAGVVDQNNVYLFLNANLEGTEPLPYGFTPSDGQFIIAYVDENPEADVVIGGKVDTKKNNLKISQRFSGIIEDVLIFTEALTKEQILEVFSEIRQFTRLLTDTANSSDETPTTETTTETPPAKAQRFTRLLTDTAGSSDETPTTEITTETPPAKAQRFTRLLTDTAGSSDETPTTEITTETPPAEAQRFTRLLTDTANSSDETPTTEITTETPPAKAQRFTRLLTDTANSSDETPTTEITTETPPAEDDTKKKKQENTKE